MIFVRFSASRTSALSLLTAALLCLGFLPVSAEAQTVTAEPSRQLSVVRVNITCQAWDYLRPWGKKSPISRRAVGAVISGNRVLVTGEFVANADYVEFETPEGGQKAPARVEAVDHEANIAILTTDDTNFLKPFPPLELTTASVGDTLSVWQLESNGALLVTRGSMTNAEVARYPMEDFTFLVYRMSAPLQFRESAFTVPVVKDDKLVGLIMRYDAQSNSSDIIPAPVIEHFLKDVAKPPYKGFPRIGMAYSSTRDPQFRRFMNIPDSVPGGVYVTDLRKDGPAERAGIQPGDILFRVDDQAVDQDGNYADPLYGKISVNNILSTRHFEGDEIKLSILRNGETKELPLRLTHRPSTDYVVEPYTIDRAPKFYILGGLILEELSRQYLKEWGADWMKKAPDELVHIDREQNDLFPDTKQKVVFLSRVLPSDATIGYEQLRHLVVTKINGVEIHGLDDIQGAVEKSTDGLIKIEFSTDPGTIYLDSAQVASSEDNLMKAYRLPILKRLE